MKSLKLKVLKGLSFFLILFSCQEPLEPITMEEVQAELVNKKNNANAKLRNVPDLIDINDWLLDRPLIASQMKWQFKAGSHPLNGAYYVTDSDKMSWDNWDTSQRSDLVTAFNQTYDWYFYNYYAGIDAIPTIQQSIFPFDPGNNASVYISQQNAWQLYLRWIAHSLFVEVYQIVPWSIEDYDSENLNILFDSSRFMRRIGTDFILGFDQGNHLFQPERKNLIGQTTISAPIFTYKFLKDNNILPSWGYYIPSDAKTIVIKNLITWASENMSHFNGYLTEQNAMDYWGVQAPAFAKIVSGTTHSLDGFSHWTAGCGGTTSFFGHALRAANIPVQYLAVCDHILPVFRTEGLFMDHGDNPYNWNYKLSGLPPEVLLQNADVFTTLFNENYYSNYNILNGIDNDPVCNNVGYTVLNLNQ